MDTTEGMYQDFLRQIGEASFLEPYRKACRKTQEKLEKINVDYSKQLGRAFISQVTFRIKSPESCLNKMLKKKYHI